MNAFGDWSRRLLSIAVAILATASAAMAYDVDAAAVAFEASKGKLTSPEFVLQGWSGNDSKVDVYSIERILDPTAWRAAWARHAPETKAPEIDFSKAMVIAIFVGAVDPSVIPQVDLYDVVDKDKIDMTAMNFVYDVISGKRINPYLLVVLRRSPKALQVFAKSYGLMRTPQDATVLLETFGAVAP